MGLKTKKTYMKHVSLFVIAIGFFQDPWSAYVVTQKASFAPLIHAFFVFLSFSSKLGSL